MMPLRIVATLSSNFFASSSSPTTWHTARNGIENTSSSHKQADSKINSVWHSCQGDSQSQDYWEILAASWTVLATAQVLCLHFNSPVQRSPAGA